jgi:hypothetical protein
MYHDPNSRDRFWLGFWTTIFALTLLWIAWIVLAPIEGWSVSLTR